MPTSSYNFNDVTDGILTFTGSNDPFATIHVEETDVGDTLPFTAFQRQPVAVAGPEMGMEWSAFAATVYFDKITLTTLTLNSHTDSLGRDRFAAWRAK